MTTEFTHWCFRSINQISVLLFKYVYQAFGNEKFDWCWIISIMNKIKNIVSKSVNRITQVQIWCAIFLCQMLPNCLFIIRIEFFQVIIHFGHYSYQLKVRHTQSSNHDNVRNIILHPKSIPRIFAFILIKLRGCQSNLFSSLWSIT